MKTKYVLSEAALVDAMQEAQGLADSMYGALKSDCCPSPLVGMASLMLAMDMYLDHAFDAEQQAAVIGCVRSFLATRPTEAQVGADVPIEVVIQ